MAALLPAPYMGMAKPYIGMAKQARILAKYMLHRLLLLPPVLKKDILVLGREEMWERASERSNEETESAHWRYPKKH